jgi:hypothetical protein
MQRRLALALAIAALGISLVYVALGAVCGGMESGGSQVAGQPPVTYGPRCVSAIHPFSPAYVGAAALGVVAVARGKPDVARALGVGAILLSAVLVFSLGIPSLPIGILLVAASYGPRREETWLLDAPRALATVGLLLALVGFFGALFAGFTRPWRPGDEVTAFIGLATWGCIVARARIAGLALATLALGWGAYRIPENALGDILPAAWFLAAAGLAWRQGALGPKRGVRPSTSK